MHEDPILYSTRDPEVIAEIFRRQEVCARVTQAINNDGPKRIVTSLALGLPSRLLDWYGNVGQFFQVHCSHNLVTHFVGVYERTPLCHIPIENGRDLTLKTLESCYYPRGSTSSIATPDWPATLPDQQAVAEVLFNEPHNCVVVAEITQSREKSDVREIALTFYMLGSQPFHDLKTFADCPDIQRWLKFSPEMEKFSTALKTIHGYK